ncbi:MAG: FecR domain-containing protein [Deltaproteobacteria bacterium]|nr:FecR domain-containing protein [Deltaproteobacteria bacterium]
MNIKSDKDKTTLLEAKDWFLKMNFEPVTPEMQTKFQAWLAEDSSHPSKFDLIHATWENSAILENHPVVIKEMNKSLDKPRFGKKFSWLHKLRIRPILLRPIAIFATVLLVVIGIWFWQTDTDRPRMYHTGTGEQRTILVSDGSLILLDAESVVTERLTTTQRLFTLEKGRASFSVFHDPERPFLVAAENVIVRAVGTKFNVAKKRNGKVLVAVTEGSVKVSKNDNNPEASIDMGIPNPMRTPLQSQETMALTTTPQDRLSVHIVDSGQQVIIDDQEADLRIKPVDVETADSWKNGRLYFVMEPLSEVIDEINRYLERKIKIDDESIGDIRISVNFDIRHRNNFLIAIQKALPITIEQSSNNTVLLKKK